MITLNDITLCAIDCSTPRLALRALNISMQQCLFADVLFFSDTADEFELPGCRMVTIPKITSRADYSRWVIKDLGRFFKTSHVLIIQWDGYIVNAEAWRAEFLDFDYIGAPWGFHRDNHRLGTVVFPCALAACLKL